MIDYLEQLIRLIKDNNHFNFFSNILIDKNRQIQKENTKVVSPVDVRFYFHTDSSNINDEQAQVHLFLPF